MDGLPWKEKGGGCFGSALPRPHIPDARGSFGRHDRRTSCCSLWLEGVGAREPHITRWAQVVGIIRSGCRELPNV